MKKTKLFAVLSAAMLGCCAMGGTAFAEETEPVDYSQYQLGDITMDGVVDVEDAQLALQCYTNALANHPFEYIPYEQQLLACAKGFTVTIHEVFPKENRAEDTVHVLTIEEAQDIVMYYCDSVLAKKSDSSYEDWIASQEYQQEIFSGLYEAAVESAKYTYYDYFSFPDPETGERVLRSYSTATVQKVRE